MSETGDIRARMSAAIAQTLTGSYVTRWVALIEVLDEDGERAVWSLAADDQRAWDTLGLLTFAVQLEQASIMRGNAD